MGIYKKLVAKTKLEKDCSSYDLHIDRKDPGHFIFIEEWSNQEATDTHCNTEHFTRLVPLINSYAEKEGTFILMEQTVSIDT